MVKLHKVRRATTATATTGATTTRHQACEQQLQLLRIPTAAILERLLHLGDESDFIVEARNQGVDVPQMTTRPIVRERVDELGELRVGREQAGFFGNFPVKLWIFNEG